MSRRRVLIVDDERLVLSSLRRLLLRGDFEVGLAGSAREGLEALEKEAYDLVLSDYKMPGMNGIDFLREVARRWPAIVRVMLTAQADKELLDQALAEGLLQHAYTKPWDNRQLLEGLRAAVY